MEELNILGLRMVAIFCRRDGKWKHELEERLGNGEKVFLLAIGSVKYKVLAYLKNIMEFYFESWGKRSGWRKS